MELGLGPGKSWKMNQMVAAFLARVCFAKFWAPRFSVLNSTLFHFDSTFWLDSTLKLNYVYKVGNSFSTYIWKSDLFDIHSIKESWKDMENRHKWSWKVLENTHKRILESHGKPRLYAPCKPLFFCLWGLLGEYHQLSLWSLHFWLLIQCALSLMWARKFVMKVLCDHLIRYLMCVYVAIEM